MVELITQREVDMEFAERRVHEVLAVRLPSKQWHFRVRVKDAHGRLHDLALATLRDRAALRTWADPRAMFDFLQSRYGITSGTFVLEGG